MNISFPIIELIDRLTIAKIKIEKGLDSQIEYEYYFNQAIKFDLEQIQPLINELEKIHRAIWLLESELKSGVEDKLPLEEIGRRAILIRDWNNKRIAVKNQIAKILNCSVREIKKDHLSE